jgi:cytoskeletal protein RodZ
MPTFGEELRRERELRGIPLRDVSEATKISLRYLRALESDDFEHLPGGVFNRGFVRAYSQFIGIDPNALVDAYILAERSQAASGKAKDRDAFHRPSSGIERGAAEGRAVDPRRGWRLLVIAGLVLATLAALAAIAYVVWRGFEKDAPARPRSSVARDAGERIRRAS